LPEINPAFSGIAELALKFLYGLFDPGYKKGAKSMMVF
jgi:hypothetical protein